MNCELKALDAVAVPCGSKRTCPFRVEVPATVMAPCTVRVAVGVVVPMPTAPVVFTKIGESTTEDVPENSGTNPRVPPVVVTFEATLDIIGDTALAVSDAG